MCSDSPRYNVGQCILFPAKKGLAHVHQATNTSKATIGISASIMMPLRRKVWTGTRLINPHSVGRLDCTTYFNVAFCRFLKFPMISTQRIIDWYTSIVMLHRVVQRSWRSTARFPAALQDYLHPKHHRCLRTLPAFSLGGRTCVVTGGAGGLGKAFLILLCPSRRESSMR